MKFLILGGTRLMGIHLVNTLLSQGHDITIATRGKAADPFGSKVQRLIKDRPDPTSLATLKGHHYNATIDNLAYSSNDVKHLLDVLQTEKYIQTSTVSVYAPNFNKKMHEDEVNTKTHPINWCDYQDLTYDEAKRQAEAALFQAYPSQSAAAVRIPYVFGHDDYTQRLYFYIENIVRQRPMHIDNLTASLSFIDSQEAGQFLAHAATSAITGPVNAASQGAITLEEIIRYTESRASKKAIIDETGTPGTLNGCPAFGLDTTKATNSGFVFKSLDSWVYPLIDRWIGELEGQ